MSSFIDFKIWLWLGCFAHKFPALAAIFFLTSFAGSLIVPSLVLKAIPLSIFFLSGMGLIFSMPGQNWQVGVIIAQKFLKTHPEYKPKLEVLIKEMRQTQESNLKMIQWISVKKELERIEEKRRILKNSEQKLMF